VALNIAVDAINLAADQRGMGRYVRSVLECWAGSTDLEITLLVRDRASSTTLGVDWPFRISLVHARGNVFDAVWYPWNGIRFDLNARRVVTIHDAFAFTLAPRGFIARRREQSPIRRAARFADAFTTVSQWSAGEISRELGIARERLTVIPPVCSTFWQPVTTEPREKPYVLFVGGSDARKNAAMLFAAFAHAFPKRDIELVVAGGLRADDERLLERSAISEVRIRPNDAALRELYSNALAVAVPSVAEGYGLTAVEAMACGAPVLAADAAALPEACDGAAELLPPLDVEAWSAALQRVARDSALRAELRAKSLARATRIDPAAPAREILAVLRG
jgi:glycosyltransferase involved in cell wall biosynthesis